MLRSGSIALALAGLEKTRFLRGEQILVWLVTELGSGEHRAIPAALLYKQRIIFTRPDGTTRVDSKPMPIDGWQLPGAYGSRYPHTLKGETPSSGDGPSCLKSTTGAPRRPSSLSRRR